MGQYKYMHTMDGEPATYVPGEQICFCTRTKFGAADLCESMKQIRQQRKLSAKWRKKHGFEPTPWPIGFIMVKV